MSPPGRTRRRNGVRRWRAIGFGAGVTALAVAFILLSPILIPLAGFLHWRDQKRMVAAARRFACTDCGEVIGERAMALAEEEWARQMAERAAQSPPGTRFRIVRHLHAICPHCGAQYGYAADAGSFVRLARHASRA